MVVVQTQTQALEDRALLLAPWRTGKVELASDVVDGDATFRVAFVRRDDLAADLTASALAFFPAVPFAFSPEVTLADTLAFPDDRALRAGATFFPAVFFPAVPLANTLASGGGKVERAELVSEVLDGDAASRVAFLRRGDLEAGLTARVLAFFPAVPLAFSPEVTLADTLAFAGDRALRAGVTSPAVSFPAVPLANTLALGGDEFLQEGAAFFPKVLLLDALTIGGDSTLRGDTAFCETTKTVFLGAFAFDFAFGLRGGSENSKSSSFIAKSKTSSFAIFCDALFLV